MGALETRGKITNPRALPQLRPEAKSQPENRAQKAETPVFPRSHLVPERPSAVPQPQQPRQQEDITLQGIRDELKDQSQGREAYENTLKLSLAQAQKRYHEVEQEYESSRISIGSDATEDQGIRDKYSLGELPILQSFNPFRQVLVDIVRVDNPDGTVTEYVDRHQKRFLFWTRNDEAGVYKETYVPDKKGKLHLSGSRQRVGEHIQIDSIPDPEKPEETKRVFSIQTATSVALEQEANALQREIQAETFRILQSQERAKPAAQRARELMASILLDKKTAAEKGIASLDTTREDPKETMRLKKILLKELGPRSRYNIDPDLPNANIKLGPKDLLPLTGQFLKNVFVPFGKKQFVHDRTWQLAYSLTSPALFYPIPGLAFTLRSLTVMSVFSGVNGFDLPGYKRFQKLRKEYASQQLFKALERTTQLHPEIRDRNELLQKTADRLYTERNWKKIQRLQEKEPEISVDQHISRLRKQEARNTKIKWGVAIGAGLTFGALAGPLSWALGVAGIGVTVPAIITGPHVAEFLVATPTIFAKIAPLLKVGSAFGGLKEFLALWGIGLGVGFVWRLPVGLMNVRGKWREAQKAIEKKKNKQ